MAAATDPISILTARGMLEDLTSLGGDVMSGNIAAAANVTSISLTSPSLHSYENGSTVALTGVSGSAALGLEVFTVSANTAIGANSIPVTAKSAGFAHDNTSIAFPWALPLSVAGGIYVGVSTTGTREWGCMVNTTYGANSATWTDAAFSFTSNSLANAQVYLQDRASTFLATVTANNGQSITHNSTTAPVNGTPLIVAMFNEPSGGAYARVAVSMTPAVWKLLSYANQNNGQYSSAQSKTALNFPAATLSWGKCTEMFLSDSGTTGAGRLLAAFPLTSFPTVLAGQVLSVLAGGANLQLGVVGT